MNQDNVCTSTISNTHSETKATHTPIPIDTIICGNAAEVLKTLPANSIDLVVTSPPYDNLRMYHGFTLDLHQTGKQLYRVLKHGGVVVMVIQDQTKRGAKSLTSFRTIVDWCATGFQLFETIIYQKKHSAPGCAWNKRFRVDHEYMPVFVKGMRPAYFDKRHLAIPCKNAGQRNRPSKQRLSDGTVKSSKRVSITAPTKCRGTIWPYANVTTHNDLKRQHPATFSDQLAHDFIGCFCPEGGVVIDPFVGSGTTAVAAKKLGRHYIGIDISQEYCHIARARLAVET